MAESGNKHRVAVNLSSETKAALDALKHPGQSYNGFMKELIGFWRSEHGIEAAVEREPVRSTAL